MRANRFRRAVEEPMLPTYELVLDPEEEARAKVKTLENIEKGSQLMLKCSMVQEHFSNLVFRRKGVEVGNGNGQSKTLTIDSFSDNHIGYYECGGTRKKDGKYHSRHMKVVQKREINSDLPVCSKEFNDYCGMHGACLMDGSRKICHCDAGFMGEQCDQVLMAAYEGMPLNHFHMKMLKVVGGTTTSLNVVCIIFAIIFALLYFKERKSLRRLRKDFEKVMKPCETEIEICKETTTNSLSIYPEETNDGSSQRFPMSGIRKIKLALNRAHLDGTTDSKLLEK